MLRDKLVREIEKWSDKLDKKIAKLGSGDKEGERILKNALSYRKDSDHFFENDDLIESFEALIWAWAFVEIGEDLDHLKSKD